MSDLDLDRLGDVWREQPNPAELAELLRSAETARRRARWAQFADVVAAVAVAIVVAVLVLRNPEPPTLVVGGGAILILIISHMRQRKLRAAELKSLTGTSEEMLDQAIERVRLSLKRSRFGAIALAPAFLIGLLVAHVANLGADLVLDPDLRTAALIGGGAVTALMAASLIRSYAKARNELERLLALRESYLRENNSFTVE